MVKESEPGRFKDQGRYQGRGQGQGIGYFNKILSSSLCNREEVKFVTSLSKQFYTYTSVMDTIFHRVQRAYGYEVASSLRSIEEYDMIGKIPTIIMSLYTDTNTRDTNNIGLDKIYQADITDDIKRSIQFKQNLCMPYIAVWQFCNKQLQKLIKTNVEYKTKKKYNQLSY